MRKKLWVLFVLAVTLAAADSAYMSKHKSQRAGSQLVTVSATAEPSPNFTISTEPIFNSYQTDRFVAHRGLSDHAPENTVPAFELAGKAGFWGIETDIIETLDGVFMCMHDDELDRTTNGSGMVIDHTYNELSQLCVDYGNDISDYPDLKIPTMIEFLNMCVIYDCVPVIEIKQIDNYEAFLKTIEESGLMNRCIISGGIEDLKQIRALNTSIPLMVVGYSNKPYTFYTELIKELPDNSGILYDYHSVDKSVIDELHASGLLAGVWTLDTGEEAAQYMSYGVDFVVTNHIPGLNHMINENE
ncbi:MAG: glycerophosphodiester phosphodiesterase family protein [Clostridia bacterium]|nr:glycerophosphodiester phosphodiesterase family protein [Clostridia bacterium]